MGPVDGAKEGLDRPGQCVTGEVGSAEGNPDEPRGVELVGEPVFAQLRGGGQSVVVHA